MNNKNNVNNDTPTVFKSRSPQQSNITPPIANAETVIKVMTSQHQLTRIRESIRVQDSSIGFETAKNEADDALQQQKIVLKNRFVLESTLGAGGMGTVYKALDLRKVEASDIKTEIAVKVLNDEFKNHPDAFVSLQREASRSHILSHPNIVTVHDFDRDGDVIFMTMELLNGRPLDAVLRDYSGTGMSVELAIPIIKGYCNALSFAHEKHFIHSDLKPGNVFVTDEGTKVLDFGIARINNNATMKDHFDAGDLGALTPAYASLEMLNGDDPHPSDDVYAAALIAYELFSGKHPFNRLPANEVRDQKLKPKRLKELSKKQWLALELALVVERDKRTQSIDDFWNAFANKKRLPIFIFTSAILLVVTAWFSYNTFVAPSEMAELADSTFVKANECINNKEAQCAIEATKAVLKLNPDYIGASSILKQAHALKLQQQLDMLFTDIRLCLDDKSDVVCAEKTLYKMQNVSKNAAQTIDAETKLITFKEQLTISNSLQNAQHCLNQKSYSCVIEQTNVVLGIEPEHEQGVLLNSQAHEQINALEEKRIATQQQYELLIIKAQKCFDNNDYSCSKISVDNALTFISTDEARTLQRQAEIALFKQQRNALEKKRNQDKAASIMVKAHQCLTKKQYDCAIAKSESALNLTPNHSAALKTLKSATQERQKLKTNFSLQ